MTYNNCPLFKLQSKKKLFALLGIRNSKVFSKQNKISSLTMPYVDVPKPRLIEPSNSQNLKQAQKIIKNALQKINIPSYVFSGVKGKSYAGNAKYHLGVVNVFQTDLTAFFPNTKRDKVYRFFLDELQTSPDVAEILTNITTIDINKTNCDKSAIVSFLTSKNVKRMNHLISGSPTSTILAYFANHVMFDEIYNYANKQGVKMTVYVDDITFSSSNKISSKFKKSVLSIIRKHGHMVSLKKTESKDKRMAKCITGVIITPQGNIAVKNSLRHKTIIALRRYKENPTIENKNVLRGYVNAARQVENGIYPSIMKLLKVNNPS